MYMYWLIYSVFEEFFTCISVEWKIEIYFVKPSYNELKKYHPQKTQKQKTTHTTKNSITNELILDKCFKTKK